MEKITPLDQVREFDVRLATSESLEMIHHVSPWAPGLRPRYDANYCGAFVHDPDGNKIEVVTYSAR